MDILKLMKRHWFFAGTMIAIFLAEIFPELGAMEGPLNPEVTVKYGAVSLIFLVSGLSIKLEELLSAVTNVKIHIFIQLFSQVFTPIFMKILTIFLWMIGVNEWILKGLVTVGCMPPPVSSAVILTRAVGGNEAAAIFNSVLGCLIGIVLTPFTLLFFLRATTLVPVLSTIFQLAVTVMVPLAVGQLICFATDFKASSYPIGILGQIALLFIIFITFCQAFQNQDMQMNAHDILITVLLVVLILVFITWLVFWISSKMTGLFCPEDVIAIMFCCTHKSLTLGMPMLRILYGGYAHLSTISLPLLVYHPTQIIMGGLLVAHLQDWMRSRRQSRTRLEA
ncbi:sodium/bile acid cotransporter 7-like isoform X2 [Zootermopsis nevadensis]|uniref:Sodium/bile acid cotransporter 7 n=1 Tax=Zootermopsis nevadensis TaxID=136037 RepID=A0A067R9N6_ZOONE|nr:sodium/bile acid cotransporter 7-like isoform X2 [Zootermopsis nevadensis]KDR15266.1 Sodium/bile acid cotransporter 7 [Zootermopsis nevadensis]